MKKLISCIMIAVISASLCVPVRAESKSGEIVYSNELGLELTKEEYDVIIGYIDEDKLALFNRDEIDYIMSDIDNNMLGSEETYVKTTYQTVDGEEQIVNEEYLTREEMEDSINLRNVDVSEISPFILETRVDTVTTNMKSIVLDMWSVGASVKKVIITCTWLDIPQCKSYDVIALRGEDASYSFDIEDVENTVGYQNYDGKSIKYLHTNGNMKKSPGCFGLSVNIVDSVTSSLSVSLSATFCTKQDPLIVYGTYQHAVNNVTLAQSQNYDFSVWGMGQVLDFSSDVWSKYDNTPGLYVVGSYKDES